MSIIINGSTTLAGPTLIGPVQPLLLDTYTGAAAAYSLRKLRTAYSGAAIRVRRSSDGVQLNIGFDDSNNLDENALLSFCGSSSGNIVTWYDQSTNARDMTESSLYPTIVLNGSIYKINNKPTIIFNGTTSRLFAADYVLNNSSVFSVARSIGTTSNNFQTIFGRGSGGSTSSRDALLYFNTNTGVNQIEFQRSNGSTFPTAVVSGISLNTTFLATGIYNGTELTAYRNGNAGNSVNTTIPGTQVGINTSIGVIRQAATQNVNFFNGYISEVIVYASNQSSNRSAIESNINQYYNIY